MSSESQVKKARELEAKRESLFAGPLKHVRSAALVAALVPVALVAATPVTASAQDQCSGGCPTPVPEPSTLLLLAPSAAALMLARRRWKK